MSLTKGCFHIISGRTHAATVKNLDELKSAVNVEWEEDGVSKGKGVSIDCSYALVPSDN